MALFDPPHLGVRSRVEKSPLAMEQYVAFETVVQGQLATWPKRSTDLATGFIMSAWTVRAAKQGLISIPAGRLKQIANLGKRCGGRMNPVESAWAQELMDHLMAQATPAIRRH